VYVVDGSCWISYLDTTGEAVPYRRIWFCVDDIMLTFFTVIEPVDKEQVVQNVITHLPYCFLVTADERVDAAKWS
jgi:hypothetical protein